MRHLIFLKCILITLLVIAQVTAFASTDQPFMWKVQYRAATVYLVGSIHALTPDFYPLAQAYEEAFSEADRIAVELDPTVLDPHKSARLVQSKMWLPQGITIEDYLSESQKKQLKDFCKTEGTQYERIIHLRPWMLVEQLTQAQLKDSNYQSEFGLDLYFLNKAKQKNLPILEIETLQQQISAIADVPFQAQLAMLTSSLEQMDDVEYMSKMSGFWRQADSDGLYQFVYQDVLDTPELKPVMESLLDDRNQRMADVISIYLGQGEGAPLTTFVVVGALHLSGPNSIIKELEQKGFYAQPMFTIKRNEKALTK